METVQETKKEVLVTEAAFETNQTITVNPIDVVESLVEFNGWMFDRHSDNEMAVQVPGTWCDYSLYFAYSGEMEAVQFTCVFDMRVAEDQKHNIVSLLALINNKLWLGHFDIWAEEGLPIFRHALPTRGSQISTGQLEDIITTAITECERFYPAFQYVIWCGKTAEEAFQLSMIDTVGEA